MKKKTKNIILGLLLIAFAVLLFLDKMEMIPSLPLLKIGGSAVLLYFAACSLKRLEFFFATVCLGAIAWLFSVELGIDKVAPSIIIVAAALVGIGLNLIFGRSKVKVVKDTCENVKNHCGNNWDGGATVEYNQSEGSFDIDNNFGNKTEYVTVKNLKRGTIDNAMGSLTVYLNGTTIADEGAHIEADNGLGALVIYVPKDFRVNLMTENGLGKIETHGFCSQDESLPLLTLKVDNGLGSTDIYFE